jgi:type II secretory pathway component GspD/PulD (secretin)
LLNNAIDSERRGEYEAADQYLREVQLHRAELSPGEQQELDRLHQGVAQALDARREGAARLSQAEQLFQQGRAADVAEIVKRLAATEPYLAPADRQRLGNLRSRLPGVGLAPAAPVADPVGMVRQKVAQARALIAHGSFEAAEALARQAQMLGAALPAGEDNPQKVLETLDQTRKDPRVMLQAARSAMQQGDLDRATHYAQLSEKMASGFTFPFWGDTPAKALKDIQAARARNPQAPAQGPAQTAAVPQPPPTMQPGPMQPQDAADKARVLIRQGRQAIFQGDLVLARRCADEADGLHSSLGVSEDNPARLRADLDRLQGGRSPAAPAPTGQGAHEQAVGLVKQGRESMRAGRIEEAQRLGLQARAMHADGWSIFEDTPETLLKDVEKARQEHDRKESENVLTEARRRFEQKDYANAKKMAFQAMKLHGPYNSITDLGDRPDKLLAEIQKAEQALQKNPLPPPPAVAKNPAAPAAPAPDQPGQAPGRRDHDMASMYALRSQQMLAEARAAATQGDFDKARQLVSQARALPVHFTRPGQENPDMVLRDIEQMAQARARPPAPMQSLAANPLVPRSDAPDSHTQFVSHTTSSRDEVRSAADAQPAGGQQARARAQQLIAEIHQLQRQRRLMEARQKLEEVQKLGVVFAPNEETPGAVYQQLALQARQEIDALVRQAGDTLRYGTDAPAVRYHKAEQVLNQAGQLARAFGQDMAPVEHGMRWLASLRSGNGQDSAGPAGPPAKDDTPRPRPGQTEQGLALLEKIRLELKSGSTGTARRLAEQAVSGSYGVRDEALALLRSIDAEEMNQRALSARHAFDAANKAFVRHEYQQAAAMLAIIDPRLLDEGRRNRMGELWMTPEMQPSARGRLARGGQEAQEPGTLPVGGPRPAAGNPSRLPAEAGHANANDNTQGDPLLRTQQMREIALQKCRNDCNKVLNEAMQKFRVGETDEAIEQLEVYLTELTSEMSLAPSQMTLLTRPVKARLEQFRLMKAREDFRNQNQAEMMAGKTRHDGKVRAEEMKEKNVAEMMRQFKDLYDQHKYAEAEGWAMRAAELDGDNPAVTAAVYMSRMARNKQKAEDIKEGRRRLFADGLNEVEDQDGAADAVDHNGIAFPRSKDALDRQKLRDKHKGDLIDITPRLSEKEKEIERQLTKSVQLNFKDAPLRNVIDDLRAFEHLNIFVDESALGEEGISLDRPVTIQLENVSLKSALNLLLHQMHLQYVIQNEVLTITTQKHAHGNLTRKTYQVADLVIPVPNFGTVGELPFQNPFLPMDAGMQPNAPTPAMSPYSMMGGTPVGSPSGTSPNSGGAVPGSGFGGSYAPGGTTINKTAPTKTNEETLIKLITSTIQPESWSEMGGPGTIEYFPQTYGLVINQTPDIQDQVQDLLQALRRLQDQEVAVEVKFIAVAEDFFERIGVNFNMNIVNKGTSTFQPQLLSGQFAPAGYIDSFSPHDFLAGSTIANTLTSTLDIPITQNSFFATVPTYGQYLPVGLTMGLAFLSDIQVFLFMEAVQGDQRSNVMQAPKVTLFNGQTATLTVTDMQPFVTGVQILPQQGLFTYFPRTTIVPASVSLTLNAVLSADRRFVRLSLNPILTNLSTPTVSLFPIVTPIFPLFDGLATGQPVMFTQFIQQPRIAVVNVATTVAVPDGGTVLMGGLKRLAEQRSEYGPPILSKIPYLSRLFKNTGYGRSTESLLIMVTPRVIVQTEEQEIQTGYREPSALAP